MNFQCPQDSLKIIKELPPGITIKNIAINDQGDLLAMESSDKSIKLFERIDEKWKECREKKIKIEGSAIKIRWLPTDFGPILLVLTEMKKLFAYKKILKDEDNSQEYKW